MILFLKVAACILFVYFCFFYRSEEQKEESKAIENTPIDEDIRSKLEEYIEIINRRNRFVLVSKKYREIISDLNSIKELANQSPTNFREALIYREKLLNEAKEEVEKIKKKNNIHTDKKSKEIQEYWAKIEAVGLSVPDIDRITEKRIQNNTKIYDELIERRFKELNVVYDVSKIKQTCHSVNSDFWKEVKTLDSIIGTGGDIDVRVDFIFWCAFLNIKNYLSAAISLISIANSAEPANLGKFLTIIDTISGEIRSYLNNNDVLKNIDRICSDLDFINKYWFRIDCAWAENINIKEFYVKPRTLPPRIITSDLKSLDEIFKQSEEKKTEEDELVNPLDIETNESFFKQFGAKKLTENETTHKQITKGENIKDRIEAEFLQKNNVYIDGVLRNKDLSSVCYDYTAGIYKIRFKGSSLTYEYSPKRITVSKNSGRGVIDGFHSISCTEIDPCEEIIDSYCSTSSADCELSANQFNSLESEFEALVKELSTKGFTQSIQVSEYIRKNRLSKKYKRLSGNLKMEKDGSTYIYRNGIHPKYYKRLCTELNLTDKQSRARVIKFTSNEDLDQQGELRDNNKTLETSEYGNDLRDLYKAMYAGKPGEDIYLTDGCWLTPDGDIVDRGR